MLSAVRRRWVTPGLLGKRSDKLCKPKSARLDVLHDRDKGAETPDKAAKMNRRVRQILCVVAIVSGVFCVVWGFNHFNDPIVVQDYKGYPMPTKRQFGMMAFGAFLIYGGFVYLDNK